MKIYKVYLLKERKTDNIVYVGLTRQTLHKRFLQHVSRKKVNHNNHYINLVQEDLTIEQAVALEELLIIQYDTRKNGLNVSPKSINGYSNYHSTEQKEKWSKERKGKPVSKEHAEKNRIARLGKTNSDEHNKIISEIKSKRVICLNNGKTYDSARKAAKDLKVSYSKISLVCNGKRKHTKGYIFKFC